MVVSGIGAGGLTPINIYESLAPSGGGGGGEQQRWAVDSLAQVAAWVAGALTIPLTQTPVDTDGLTVLSEGQILHPTDFTVLTGPYRVQINFGADPATDTDDGTWDFTIRYPYLL